MKRKFIFFLPLLLAMSACGTEVNNLVLGGVDKSGLWNDNYYTKWNEKYKESRSTSVVRELDDNDMVFTSYFDENFLAIDKNDYKFSEIYEDDPEYYGNVNKLSKSNESFKHNFTSKLFDGIMECGGRYEKVRVQTNSSGFSIDFGAKCKQFDYFAMQFKSSFDFKQHTPVESCSSITLFISFYKYINNSVICETVSSTLIVPTNGIDDHCPLASEYIFFGFTLASVPMLDVCGLSIEYTLNSNDKYGTDDMPHALLIYEIFMPNSRWAN